MQGWLALGPLVAILGVDRLTMSVLGILLLAVLGGWIFHVANLTAVGYGERRFAFIAPTVGIAGAFAFAILVRAVPGLKSVDAVLFLVGAGATLGASAHFLFHAARLAGDAIPEWISRRMRTIVLADAHASVVLMMFLWLALAGFM